MKGRILLTLAAVVGLGALVVGVVWAFNVSGSGENLAATTNCTPDINVEVGSAGPLVPGVKADVPVTVADVDNCAGVGVTITSATPTLTGTASCPAGYYTVGTRDLPLAVPDGGSNWFRISVTLDATAPDGCAGDSAGLTVAVAGTVP